MSKFEKNTNGLTAGQESLNGVPKLRPSSSQNITKKSSNNQTSNQGQSSNKNQTTSKQK